MWIFPWSWKAVITFTSDDIRQFNALIHEIRNYMHKQQEVKVKCDSLRCNRNSWTVNSGSYIYMPWFHATNVFLNRLGSELKASQSWIFLAYIVLLWNDTEINECPTHDHFTLNGQTDIFKAIYFSSNRSMIKSNKMINKYLDNLSLLYFCWIHFYQNVPQRPFLFPLKKK